MKEQVCNLKELERKIGYVFRNSDFLKQAITHSSFSNEQKINRFQNYERLEFLGDAILELVTSEFLYSTYEKMPEGELTKMRASLVCEPALAYCARDLHLGDFLLLGKGEEHTGGRERDSIIADVVEAIIGAIYLDAGIERAKEFIFKFVLSDLENKQLFYDSKSNLQEIAQRTLKKAVIYQVIGEKGPEHCKEFQVEVYLDQEYYGTGSGKTKKAAEQKAAYEALIKLRNQGYVFKKY